MTTAETINLASLEPNVKVETGSLVSRLTFSGTENSDKFELTALVGSLSNDQLKFDDATVCPVASIDNAALTTINHSYRGHLSAALAKQRQEGEANHFFYDREVLLKGLVTTQEEIEERANQLVDNQYLKDNEYSWHVSTLGLVALRAIHRALHIASNSDELDKPLSLTTKTFPQIRADCMGIVGGWALEAFLVMPLGKDS